ncbi:MAG TPA: arylsulfatase [Planctomycetota bacterium]|nr:arylsulfatase [Planctomycetota bacterium]
MNRTFLLAIACFSTCVCINLFAADAARPNVIFILADDLGYGDLGCYGQQKIKTPAIDKLAAEGTRFTQVYAGCTVCAPSRCALMTGKHTGHATIRGNMSPEPAVRADEICLAEIFKAAGYSTAMIGKWGVGLNDSTGAPNKKGFDYFLGYLTQQAAHNYYPPFIWKNAEKYPLDGNAGGKQGVYTHDLFAQEALKYIREKRDVPFFLYLPFTIPHTNNEAKPNGMQVPSDAPYSDEKWPATEKNFAAMITRMDSDIGKIMALLKELNLDERTLVIFTSDNGPHKEGGHDSEFFKSRGALRGIKRDLYEGGIRIPAIARWPGKVPAGVVSDQVWAFWDVLPTMAEFTGQKIPGGIDGVSVLPALLGKSAVEHPPLYWEFHERGFSQAVRMGDWKAVKPGLQKPWELYDLAKDVGEEHDVAEQHKEIIAKVEEFVKSARVDSELFPIVPKPKAATGNK